MNYSDFEKLLLDKYRQLSETNNQFIEILTQKNKIDAELQILQVKRQALSDSIGMLESRGQAILSAAIEELEQKLNINKETLPLENKKLIDKSNINIQPTIQSE